VDLIAADECHLLTAELVDIFDRTNMKVTFGAETEIVSDGRLMEQYASSERTIEAKIAS
jgi:hypothetical protein